MKRVKRRPLGRKVFAFTVTQTRKILRLPEGDDRKTKAKALWDESTKRTLHYREQIKGTLRTMAPGALCMYCEYNTPETIEHFWPKSKYPERTFCWENLLLICDQCNRIKNDNFRVNACFEPLFVDPTRDDPAKHLFLSPKEGRFVDGDEKGEPTEKVLNQWGLIQRRKEAWDGLQTLLVRYATARQREDVQLAEEVKKDIIHRPFTELLHFLLEAIEVEQPERYFDPKLLPEICGVIHAHRTEIQAWIKIRESAEDEPEPTSA